MSPSNKHYPTILDLLVREKAVIVGFDTEFVPPEIAENPSLRSKADSDDFLELVSRKNDVVSYQAYVISPLGRFEWIEVMPKGERMTFTEVIDSIVRKGIKEKVLKKIPKKVLLAAHWSLPDLTSFEDYDKIKGNFDGVGRTQVSLGSDYVINLYDKSRNKKAVAVELFDTILLAPENARKLGNLGNLLGVSKVELPIGAIDDMRRLLAENRELFERYALMDARIAAEWLCFCCGFNYELFGDVSPPKTLGGIAVKFTIQQWEKGGIDQKEVLGMETETLIDGTKFEQPNVIRWRFDDLAIEAFYGGRNETFFFGASLPGKWYDFDLCGAYVTALSMIEAPDWEEARGISNLRELDDASYGAANVEFSFPKETRYPCLPVRAENALIFPLQGTTIATATEISLAMSFGARVRMMKGMGYVLPRKKGVLPFALISKHITEKRAELAKKGLKGTPEELMYKTIGNSVYGKLSQGLKAKRRFDPRSGATKPIGPSRVTMPFIAAEVTALIRGVIAEILNNLPECYSVISVTTDGFITNAPQEVVEKAAIIGKLGKRFFAARQKLDPGAASYLELKHEAKQILAWRTRGQATLVGGDNDTGLILAKAGLSVPDSRRNDPNQYIVEKFINRHKEDLKDRTERFRGLSEIYKSSGKFDLNKKLMWITTRMDFDWKRLRSFSPDSSGMRPILGSDHVYFDTRPLPSLECYKFVRGRWLDFVKRRETNKSVLMTMGDVEAFESYLGVSPVKGLGVLRGANAQSKVLVRMFLRAQVRNMLGLVNDLKNQELVKKLAESGIEVSVHDVENARRAGSTVLFECLYWTREVENLVDRLKERFPEFDPSPLICSNHNPLDYDDERHSRLAHYMNEELG